MPDIPADLVMGGAGGQPSAAAGPPAGPPAAPGPEPAAKADIPSDLVFAGSGSKEEASAPSAGDGDVGYGQAARRSVVHSIPFAEDVGAGARAAASYLAEPFGTKGSQPYAGKSFGERFTQAKRDIGGEYEEAEKEHPYITLAAGMLPYMALPEAKTAAGAAAIYGGYGGLLGATNQPDSFLSPRGGVEGAIGGGLGGAAGHAVAGAIGRQFAADPERQALLGAADRLGMGVPRFMANTGPVTQTAGWATRNIPVVGERYFGPAWEKTQEQLGEHLATLGGGTGDRYGAGQAMKGALQDWIGPISTDQVDRAYDLANSMVTNPALPTPLANTYGVAQQIAQARADAHLPGYGGAVNHVLSALQDQDGLTVGGIKQLRTSVGEMMKTSILPADMSGAELKQIYAGLTADYRQAIVNAGNPMALQRFDEATNLYRTVQNNRARLAKFLGGPQAQASPENVYGALMRAAQEKGGDIDRLRLARQMVDPDAWDELARSSIGELGRDPDGNWSPARFLTGYGKISDAAKQELFGQNPDYLQSLDDVATVSRRMNQLYGRYMKRSGTEQGVGVLAAVEAAPHALAHPLGAIAGLVGGPAIAKFLTNPVTARSMAWYSRAALAVQQQATPGAWQGLARASRQLSRAAGAQLGVNVTPDQLLTAISAPFAVSPYLHEGGEEAAGDQGAPGS